MKSSRCSDSLLVSALDSEWADRLSLRISRRARHVRLVVKPPGRVEVVVPEGFDTAGLPALLAQRRDWLQANVAKMVREYGAEAEASPPRHVQLPAIDAAWQVEYDRGSRSGCRERDNRLRVTHGDDWRTPLQRWLTRTAKQVLPAWLEQVSRETGLVYDSVTIRAQRTRWGSCAAGRRISLNRGLLFLEPDLVRYLLVHELCHTVHMNHSRQYWQLVETHMYGYKALDRALRGGFARIPAWARPESASF